MLNEPISASKQFGITMRAEFHLDSGCLRIFEETAIRAEWFPPQSWLAVVSVTGYSTWGRRPNQKDLVHICRQWAAHENLGIARQD
ncbi:hypothetical protein SAMN05414139_05439 [Burkholderia sp. D7]|nr:hypothetical protein SAMN05414139_05439 [Burkholderia sp. D7]